MVQDSSKARGIEIRLDLDFSESIESDAERVMY